MKRKITHFKAKLLCISLFCTAVTMMYVFDAGCVWRRIFGIQCFGCGMTRAVMAIICGDFAGAMRYNFMVVSLPVILLYIIYDGRIFKNRADWAVLGCIACGFLVRWILALTGIL